MTGPAHLDARRIDQLAPFEEVLAELRATFAAGPSLVPRLGVGIDDGTLFLMPAVGPRTAGAKVITARDRGPGPAVQGLYVLFDTETGAPVATLDGAALTTRRTPAVSALATDVLAGPEVRRLAVFGTGVQAHAHVRAMRAVRPSIERVEIVGRTPSATELLVARLLDEGHPAVVSSPAEAASAELICTCTSSAEPVLPDDAVRSGAHINAIGVYRPDRRELGAALMGRARVFVDDLDAALEESGNLVLAIADGVMSEADVMGDLAALSRGTVGRAASDEVTVFLSVGLAVQDLAVATLAARNAGLIG